MSLYDSVSEEMRKRADRCIEYIKMKGIREDPTIKACRNLDKSTPDFSEEKALENGKRICDSGLINSIIKKAYE